MAETHSPCDSGETLGTFDAERDARKAARAAHKAQIKGTADNARALARKRYR